MTEDRGHYRKYRDINFRAAALEMIDQANKIIAEYEAQNLDLTLRQLYYQFVGRGLLGNTDKNYKQLQSVISDGRIAGLVSWTAIEDRTRNLMGLDNFSSPGQAINRLARAYRRDLWAEQPWRPEVWVEKEALVGVIQGICNELRVDFFACRGYNSQSEQWRAGQRFARYQMKGQRPIVFHLGDHDPSGLDMTRDNRDRLEMFAGVPVMVQRLALNMKQVEELNPPPNPAKLTDVRAAAYVEEFGDSSWELDALSPTYIRDLIRDAVRRVRDEELWELSLGKEMSEVRLMEQFAEDFGQ